MPSEHTAWGPGKKPTRTRTMYRGCYKLVVWPRGMDRWNSGFWRYKVQRLDDAGGVVAEVRSDTVYRRPEDAQSAATRRVQRMERERRADASAA